MSMLTLNGVVHNTFHAEERQDRKTGEVYPASDRVQILAENVLPNGEVRADLVTLKVEQIAPYQAAKGRRVRVPVGAFASGGAVVYYALKGGALPELDAA
jgi:hypothetical protein